MRVEPDGYNGRRIEPLPVQREIEGRGEQVETCHTEARADRQCELGGIGCPVDHAGRAHVRSREALALGDTPLAAMFMAEAAYLRASRRR